MISLRKNKVYLLLGLLICVLFIAYQSVIIVPEGHNGLVLSEEKSIHSESNSILKPGLHFIIPFFMKPILLDSRLQTLILSETSNESNNSSEQPITIDYFANWRVNDPVRYYQQTKNNFQLIKLLINKQITTLFNDKDVPISFTQLILHGSPAQIHAILSMANKQLKTAGIQLIAMGFKQLHLSAGSNARILNNMSIEQENNAAAQRTLGKANAELIRANADSSVNLILAKAKEQAAKIRAQGDTEAAKIYNQAFNKNPEFAAFYLNLETASKQGYNNSSFIKVSLPSNTKDMNITSLKKHIIIPNSN